MTASVRILTTSSVDSSPTILLVSPNGSKILVNCGEGCQRSFLEHSQRLNTVQAICLTHLGPEAVGGLPGAILTTADGAAAAEADGIVEQQKKKQKQQNSAVPSLPVGKTFQKDMPQKHSGTSHLPDLEIVGPLGIQEFLHSLRYFMRRDKFTVHAHVGAMENLSLSKPSRKGTKNKPKADSAEFPFTIQSLAFSETLQVERHDNHPSPHPESRKRPHPRPPTESRRQVLSFIFRTPRIPGKFLPDKAAELGVPKGPLFTQLKSGKAVVFVNESGNEQTVESSQVVTPSSPSVAVMILYYPSREVAEQVFASNTITSVVESPEACLELVIHIAPQHLWEGHGLPFWKQHDPNKTVQHVFLVTDPVVGDMDGTPFASAAFGAVTRSILCEQIYQIPRQAAADPTQQSSSKVDDLHWRHGRCMMEYLLIPRWKRGFLDSSEPCSRYTKEAASLVVEQSGALALAKELLSDQSLNGITGATNDAEGKLLFTGTGSAIPCKHRNVTGILLKQADGRSILLDVGEGTVGQLLRMQQYEHKSDSGRDDILSSIKAVWLSHPHADHHLGLIRLLKERRCSDPILLLAPTPLFSFLEEYCEIDPSIRDTYYAIDCKSLMNTNSELQKRLQHVLGISNCRALPVTHCAHAYAVILDGTSFGRVVYSGDCRPSTALARAARGTDLLIHEATFEDGMEAEAALKKHSTVGEALRVALQMDARCTVLTHFSQRYPRIPPTPTDDSYKFPIVFAFDYMSLRPGTLVAASKLTPALRLLYPEIENEDNSEAAGALCADISVAEEIMSIPGIFAAPDLL